MRVIYESHQHAYTEVSETLPFCVEIPYLLLTQLDPSAVHEWCEERFGQCAIQSSRGIRSDKWMITFDPFAHWANLDNEFFFSSSNAAFEFKTRWR